MGDVQYVNNCPSYPFVLIEHPIPLKVGPRSLLEQCLVFCKGFPPDIRLGLWEFVILFSHKSINGEKVFSVVEVQSFHSKLVETSWSLNRFGSLNYWVSIEGKL